MKPTDPRETREAGDPTTMSPGVSGRKHVGFLGGGFGFNAGVLFFTCEERIQHPPGPETVMCSRPEEEI